MCGEKKNALTHCNRNRLGVRVCVRVFFSRISILAFFAWKMGSSKRASRCYRDRCYDSHFTDSLDHALAPIVRMPVATLAILLY